MKRTTTQIHIDATVFGLYFTSEGGHKRMDVAAVEKVVHEKVALKFGQAFADGLEMTQVGYDDLTILMDNHEAATGFIDTMHGEFPKCSDYWKDSIEGFVDVRNIYGVRAEMSRDKDDHPWDLVESLETYIAKADRQ